MQLSDLLHEAREWIGHGFSAAEVSEWQTSGCSAPEKAAALRERGVVPKQLSAVWGASFEWAGTALTLGGGLSLGYLSVEEAASATGMTSRVLREMLDRNSNNSNKPPSSDPPGSGADARSGARASAAIISPKG